MNEVIKTMKERRSVRKYQNKHVPMEAIEKIAEAGTYAATGKGRQSPIIIAVTNKDIIRIHMCDDLKTLDFAKQCERI